ncbi:hypothetical protein, partial [Erwinia sp.]|uniref:hypothetical protein n=1 Tax=Erwinia citreus TaxID=558 RepID=UPI0028995686
PYKGENRVEKFGSGAAQSPNDILGMRLLWWAVYRPCRYGRDPGRIRRFCTAALRIESHSLQCRPFRPDIYFAQEDHFFRHYCIFYCSDTGGYVQRDGGRALSYALQVNAG